MIVEYISLKSIALLLLDFNIQFESARGCKRIYITIFKQKFCTYLAQIKALHSSRCGLFMFSMFFEVFPPLQTKPDGQAKQLHLCSRFGPNR
jgi:hypothetical protein